MPEVRNLDYIRNLSSKEFPDLGAKLFEALTDIAGNQNTLAQQVNGNVNGAPQAPPAVNGLQVSAQNGHFQVAITDNSPIYRGISYYVEHADNPNFTNAHTVNLGSSRNANLFLGNVNRYFRAYSSYASSPAGPPVYHGSQAQPLVVSGGGAIGGPAFLSSQGSGTGAPEQALQGPGRIPFRSATGAPPTR
jgi:hypothetical protein